MNPLLHSLLHEWDYTNKLRYNMLKTMPDYDQTEHALSSAEEDLNNILSLEGQTLFERYQCARNASAALESDTALLCGAQICLRLILTLL